MIGPSKQRDLKMEHLKITGKGRFGWFIPSQRIILDQCHRTELRYTAQIAVRPFRHSTTPASAPNRGRFLQNQREK